MAQPEKRLFRRFGECRSLLDLGTIDADARNASGSQPVSLMASATSHLSFLELEPCGTMSWPFASRWRCPTLAQRLVLRGAHIGHPLGNLRGQQFKCLI